MGGDMNEINQLFAMLLSGEDAQADRAVSLLASADSHEVLNALEQRLAEANSDERWWMARTLAVIPLPRSVVLLAQLLNDPDSDVRACAGLALGELGPISGTPGVEALAAHLAEENAHVAEICTVSLWRIGVPAVPSLLDKLQHGRTLERIRAAKALAPIESHDAIPALIAALDDESAVVEHYAQDALARMGVGMMLVRP
jgi:HEAT repeat protein